MGPFADNLRQSLRTFQGNPVRTLLTLLGIVIGVVTVVSMMGLIEGLRVQVTRVLSVLGSDVFEVAKIPSGLSFSPPDLKKYAKRPNVTLDDMRAIAAGCPSVGAVSATQYKFGQAVFSERTQTSPDVTVVGGTADWIETQGVGLGRGRFFGEMEDVDARAVAVLGTAVVDKLFPHQDPIGQEVRIAGRPVRVIGVLQRRGTIMGMVNMDGQVVLPMRFFQRTFGSVQYMEIDVRAREAGLFARAQDEVVSLLRRRRGVRPYEENNFEVTTSDSTIKDFNQISQIVSVAGVGICFLALLVGGIGILNIMLVSVTERTREIGIRKALGARRGWILGQFATEATMLALVGGALGLVLGFGVVFLVNWLTGIPAAVPAWVVALSLAMSSGVGLTFGVYPATRAARLDPVEAMRAE